MIAVDLTPSRLKEIFCYDPESGLFTRRIDRKSRKAGSVVGTKRPDGYLKTCVDGKQVLLHRLAWFYVYEKWPLQEIDHINNVRHDNRISNLRDVSPSHNQQNQKRAHKRNKSCGLLGVTWCKKGQHWKAQIAANGKRYELGSFDSPEKAHEAYLQAKREKHANCTI